jgi:predicted dehydrogenase
MVGIGGYGNTYLRSIPQHTNAVLTASIDPMPELAKQWPELQAQKIPNYANVNDFLASETEIDLAIISSPIAFHAEQSSALLNAGIHVLCEKPIAATMQEAKQMQQARDASGRFLEIGYQWCYSEAIQALKRDIIDGVFGAAKTLVTRVEWPRSSAYYTRNNWAGHIKNKYGQIVNDSPVGNATAHYLNNMLYILGKEIHTSTFANSITAECYRANPIENYDTACCRIETEAGADILFYTTHAVKDKNGPVFKYLFEKAEIHYQDEGDIIAHFENGSCKNYGNPDADRMRKLSFCIDQCLDPSHQNSICSVESASALTQCVEALQKISVSTIPKEESRKKTIDADHTLIYVPSLHRAVITAYEQHKLFSEIDIPWAVKSTTVPIETNQD